MAKYDHTVQVFKAGPTWSAHLYFADGHHWANWQTGFKTKAALLTNVSAVMGGAGDYTKPAARYSYTIVRGIDER